MVVIIKNAVIYARFSSAKQNEQSIEGQVAVCKDWAERNDVKIVSVYSDEAMTGKSDKRPGFQQMIKDSKSGRFDLVIVYKLDRFARNRYDSAMYKAQLKRNGVKVVSAMENISSTPEGILLESLLEGMAEFYSENLAQNVVRGMRQRAEKGKFLGGAIPFGYRVDAEKNFVLDPQNAPLVGKIFADFIAGKSTKEIADELNAMGHRTSSGNKVDMHYVWRLLSNEKYTGVYNNFGERIEGAIPQIVTKETFLRAQKKLKAKKKQPKKEEDKTMFYLTGKLFCGHCGANMTGDSGKNKSGAVYYYYTCHNKKKNKSCTKKSVKKDYIESVVVQTTIEEILTDENIKIIAENTARLNAEERNNNSEVEILKRQQKENEKAIKNIMTAIENGIFLPDMKERAEQLQAQKESIEEALVQAQTTMPEITKEQIEFFLYEIRSRAYEAEDQTEFIIDNFVNSVYVFDDRITINYNLNKENHTASRSLGDHNSSTSITSGSPIVIYPNKFMFAITKKIRSRN